MPESSSELLNQLYDIDSVISVPFWPPALGWWIIAILLIISGVSWWYQYYYFLPAFKRMALRKVTQLREDYQHNHNNIHLVIELSILLRRVALAKFPHHQVAGLIGMAWLQFLDETGKTQAFTKGPGKLLCTAPYQQTSSIEVDVLIDLVTAWIKKQ